MLRVFSPTRLADGTEVPVGVHPGESRFPLIWSQIGSIQFQFRADLPKRLDIGSIYGCSLFREARSMLSEALKKLHEALEIIDRHDAHLAGIHIANAICALSAQILQSDSESENDRFASGFSSY